METVQVSNQQTPPTSSKFETKQLLTLLVTCLSIAIIVIDGTVVIVTLPSIQRAFAVKLSLAQLLNSGLAGGTGLSLPSGLSPGMLATIQAVLNDAITKGLAGPPSQPPSSYPLEPSAPY